MRRVNVVGRSGSGKTTVGRALADRLGAPFVEIDQLQWGRYANWTLPPPGELRERVELATRGSEWVVDGSYGSVRDIVWSRADTVVWLDVPFLECFATVLWRTARRSLTGQVLWGIQKESLRQAFLSGDSLLLFMIRTEPRRGRLYREWLARPDYAHLGHVRLRSRREINEWLRRI